MTDEAAHKAAGGLPVVRVAEAVIKAPIDDVALCWWQAARRKASNKSWLSLLPVASLLFL